MIQYSARYSVKNMPEVTRDAMTGWLNERSRLFYDFGRLFEDDERWSPIESVSARLSGILARYKKLSTPPGTRQPSP